MASSRTFSNISRNLQVFINWNPLYLLRVTKRCYWLQYSFISTFCLFSLLLPACITAVCSSKTIVSRFLCLRIRKLSSELPLCFDCGNLSTKTSHKPNPFFKHVDKLVYFIVRPPARLACSIVFCGRHCLLYFHLWSYLKRLRFELFTLCHLKNIPSHINKNKSHS